MLPALRFERLCALLREQRNCGLAGTELHDAADSGDGNPGDLSGQAGCGRGSEEEFVVFPAVKGLGEGCGGMDGDESRIDLGGYTGLLAEVGQVSGEAVAKIDGGGSSAVLQKPKALPDAGLGVKVRREEGFHPLGDSDWMGAVRPCFG